jgi:hypothetical protein
VPHHVAVSRCPSQKPGPAWVVGGQKQPFSAPFSLSLFAHFLHNLWRAVHKTSPPTKSTRHTDDQNEEGTNELELELDELMATLL